MHTHKPITKISSRFISIILATLILSACSGTTKLNYLNKGDHVAIVTAHRTEAIEELKISNSAVGSDAKTGAGSGALVGAAWGLSCGPLAIFCSPIGALAGAVTGAATGAVVGSVRGLDSEQTTLLLSRMNNFLIQQEPQATLLDNVIKRAEKNWVVVAPPATKQIILELESLGLQSKGESLIILVMNVKVSVYSGEKNQNKPPKSASFIYQSAPNHVDSWLLDDENFIQLRLNDAYFTLAENITEALAVD